MAIPTLTPEQTARYYDDRRPELYGSLIVFLILNNLVVFLRCIARLRMKDRANKTMAIEDFLVVLTGLVVDAVIANLLVSTHFGLGLHTWRIIAEDPQRPTNLSNTFRHVWITMVLTGPAFTLIKLSLLFFYRRLFLINQKWLKVAWWVNIIYCFLWLIGATGFYAFQCSPPTWYFKQYFFRFKEGEWPPGKPIGQCKATTVEHVSMPLIFGLISDVAILFLPVLTLWNLRISVRRRIGLIALFCIGALACVLDMVRIIELRIDTDDKADPSYGVVIFLILSAACEVAAVTCVCLPVIVPWLRREYIQRFHPEKLEGYGTSGYVKSSESNSKSLNYRRESTRKLDTWKSSTYSSNLRAAKNNDSGSDSLEILEAGPEAIPMGSIGTAESDGSSQSHKVDGEIYVETQVQITSYDTGTASNGRSTFKH